MGVGVILRDTKCNCVMVANIREDNAFNPMTVEAMAVLWGLQQCMSLGISHLIIESDFHILVNSILQEEDPRSDIGNLLHHIKEWMGKFQDCRIQIFHFHCNKASHTLAHYAWTVSSIRFWYGVELDFISHVVWVDKHGL